MESRYPNESMAYRTARDALAEEEQELIRQVKAVAQKRQDLPLGGRLKDDYAFTWATDNSLGTPVTFEELFDDKDSLLLYSFMFGPGWDNPCPSCTSIVDGIDRMSYQVGQDTSLVAIGKAPAKRINDWARKRGWTQIKLISGYESAYQADYGCQGETDEHQFAKMNVFKRVDGRIFHFWGSEVPDNDLDMIWPYWNLMDLTPAGRPDRWAPPQEFRSRFLEENFSE